MSLYDYDWWNYQDMVDVGPPPSDYGGFGGYIPDSGIPTFSVTGWDATAPIIDPNFGSLPFDDYWQNFLDPVGTWVEPGASVPIVSDNPIADNTGGYKPPTPKPPTSGNPPPSGGSGGSGGSPQQKPQQQTPNLWWLLLILALIIYAAKED